MTGYMPQMYYVHQQQQRRAKPLPQIPTSFEPVFPPTAAPYCGSISGFPPPSTIVPIPVPGSKGPSPYSSLIMVPAAAQPRRHSFCETGNEGMFMATTHDSNSQDHTTMMMKRLYSIDGGRPGESTKIEQVEEQQELIEDEEEATQERESMTVLTQKPFDPSYEPGNSSTINNSITTTTTNNINKVYQTPNTPDDLVVSTTPSNSCLSPSTASPATPTCQQQQQQPTHSKIPSPWGSMVSLCLRDSDEEQALPSPSSPVASQQTVMSDQPIVMEERQQQRQVEQTEFLPSPVEIAAALIEKIGSPPPGSPPLAPTAATHQGRTTTTTEHHEEQAVEEGKRKGCSSSNNNPRFTCIVASYSLTHQKDAIKTYRRMAIKTKNKQVQMAYAKYLLDVARLYEENASMRQRLLDEGRYWISRLAKKKMWEAVFLQGQHYLESHQAAKATRCFEKAAKHGYVAAYLALAGQAEEQGDWTKALACYRSAADGHPEANYKMAMVLLQQNMNAIQVLEKAARHGKAVESGKAALVLSKIYAHTLKTSEQVEKNESKAFRYLKQAFQFNLVEAVYQMGQVHTYGLLGQPGDAWQGYQCFMKAAEEGYDPAMLELAKVYAKGIQGFIAQQPDAAFRWCQRAAERGLKEAEYTLGTYYELGVGITVDYPRALEYFGKAASKGHVEAAEKLNRPVVVPTPPAVKAQESSSRQQRCHIM